MGLEDHIRHQEALEKYYENLYKGFSNELPPALTKVAFKYRPQLAESRTKYKPLLFEIGKKYIRELWENYNFCYSLNRKDGPMADLSPVDTIKEFDRRFEKRCQKLKDTYPERGMEWLEEICREDYERGKKDLQFKLAVHEKMKAVFNTYYIDDIMDFESHVLRHFERSIYLMCASKYVDEVYSLK